MLDVRCFRSSRHASRVTRHPQRGVALIITLILLSVVTFMAITFLALSRRERSAVSTVTDTAGARLAADAALANAEAQIVANVLATTNPYNFTLLVSTNYINAAGYNNTVVGANLTNVNYFDSSGIFLFGNNFLQNLENLFYSPRPPVFIPTNSAGANDFRFYLDLNRNGQDDPNGLLPVISPDPANPYYDTNGITMKNIKPGDTLSNVMVGDPEWIGVLERPDVPHGPNNKFIARYAFIAVPVGNTLDLNAIHNQAQQGIPRLSGTGVNPPSGNDVFNRNEGVGSWEINLAAFLADLNTNEWGQVIGTPANGITKYYFFRYQNPGNVGCAFDDARALLAYRYNNNLNSLNYIGTVANLYNLFGNAGINAFSSDYIDGFSYGGNSLLTGFQLPTIDNDSTLIGNKVPWVGADNTNHFFSHQDLFNTNDTEWGATLPGFTDRLLQAGTDVSTYDRYTFYRLLSQLGTDTTPDSGKMNLNYDNLDPGLNGVLNANGVAASTNFVAWTPLGFFTNAADRLLRAYTTQWRNSNPTNFATAFYAVTNFNFVNSDQWTNYPAFGITNIPVLVSNQFVYSSAVNRLLQLAANIYDATTNSFYPSVFRPIFEHDNYGNVFIVGYTNLYNSGLNNTVSGTTDPQLAMPYEITQLSGLSGLFPASFTPINVNVYGVPWIIGAKKGFPNFNEFSMESVVQTARKLQVTRTVTNMPPQAPQYQTNQMYIFNINNSIGIECLNSYSNNYPNVVQIVLNDNLSMTLTNNGSLVIFSNYFIPVVTNVTLWPGSIWISGGLYSNPFIIPLQTNVTFMPNEVYSFGNQNFTPANQVPPPLWETNINLTDLPHFGLATSNQLQLFMLDGINPPYHVIDYVQFDGPNSLRNLNAELASPDIYDPNGMWQTNLVGVQNQLNLSAGTMAPDSVPSEDGYQWLPPPVPGITTVPQSQAYFGGLFQPNNLGSAPAWTDGSPGTNETNQSYGTQAPFTPTRTVVQYISWQANDPLVHYVASDLNYSGTEHGNLSTGITNFDRTTFPMLPDLGNVNDRYQPWGLNSQLAELDNVSTNNSDLAFKDPLMWQPDNWNFPANKFPTVGWLGRVHRGTPWQTVYLKASDILGEIQNRAYIGTNTWAQWTGDTQLTYGQYFDAANTAPIRDRLLFDLFTTAFNDNATRGTLSVNQTNLAAWSALFSGVVVLTNTTVIRVPPSQLVSPTFAWTNISPAGPAGNNSQLGQLVAGINARRAAFTNADGLAGTFEHVGDILSTRQFTEQSPFLYWNNSAQQQAGISDEMYEWLPQQTMSLLRCTGSPRYVIYCYGQALKPAPNGIYTGSGQFFGMVTNYQIVSEIATRAVVRFNSSLTNVVTFASDAFGNPIWFTAPVVTNNNAVIESFNILPPD